MKSHKPKPSSAFGALANVLALAALGNVNPVALRRTGIPAPAYKKRKSQKKRRLIARRTGRVG